MSSAGRQHCRTALPRQPASPSALLPASACEHAANDEDQQKLRAIGLSAMILRAKLGRSIVSCRPQKMELVSIWRSDMHIGCLAAPKRERLGQCLNQHKSRVPRRGAKPACRRAPPCIAGARRRPLRYQWQHLRASVIVYSERSPTAGSLPRPPKNHFRLRAARRPCASPESVLSVPQVNDQTRGRIAIRMTTDKNDGNVKNCGLEGFSLKSCHG